MKVHKITKETREAALQGHKNQSYNKNEAINSYNMHHTHVFFNAYDPEKSLQISQEKAMDKVHRAKSFLRQSTFSARFDLMKNNLVPKKQMFVINTNINEINKNI